MKHKILSQEEYDRLQQEAKESIISELSVIFAENQIVAIQMDENLFKIIKYPVASNKHDDLETLNVLVTREQLEQYIFLHEI